MANSKTSPTPAETSVVNAIAGETNAPEPAKAAESEAPEVDAAEEVPTAAGVKYIGTSDVREIDSKSFARVGAEGVKKAVWTPGSVVPLSDLSPEAMEFLAGESDFEIV